MRGGGDDVAVGERVVHDVRGDEAGDVRHVGHEVGAHLVADLPHALVVVVARVRGRAGDDQLGAVQHGVGLEGVVVDEAGVLVEPVRQGLEEDGGGGDLLLGGVEPVREVAAVGQVEAHDPVVRVEQRGVHGEIGGGAGERLDVDAPLVILEPERLERAPLAQALGLVDELVAAVVALAGKALGVLVGEARAVHLHHRPRREVLRRDELEAEALALLLLLHDGGHLFMDGGDLARDWWGTSVRGESALGRIVSGRIGDRSEARD